LTVFRNVGTYDALYHELRATVPPVPFENPSRVLSEQFRLAIAKKSRAAIDGGSRRGNAALNGREFEMTS
jgi:hypothetical protein